MRCENCDTEVLPDDNFCHVCGDDLQSQLQVNESRPQWTDKIDEAVCFHWLAQCQRRLMFPVEATEEIPYVAFEYGWKVVNRLYNQLKVPKQIDPKTGKKRKATAKESLIYLLEHFGATSTVIDENRGRIERLCDCVLEIPDPTRMSERRGFIAFDESFGEIPEDDSPDDKTAEESKTTAKAVCTGLRDALATDDRSNFANALADMLLSVRNARVHATLSKPTQRRLGNEDHASIRIKRRYGEDGMPIPDPSDYEINETAEIQLAIGKILLRAKTGQSPEDVENIVRSRVKQIKDEIYQRVTKWRRPR
jgi:hypothetical protein